MKKQLLNIITTTAVTCALFISIAHGQDINQQTQVAPKFMIGFTGGVTMPMGNFAKTDYYNGASGFAGTGGNFGFTATYFIDKHWGISELFSYHQFNFVGAENMALGMQGFPDGFDCDSVNFKVMGNNHTFNFLIGPVYTTGISKKLNLDFRLLVGFVNANLAGNSFTITDGGVTDPTFYQAVSWANTFGSQLGAALRYNISKHVSLSANVDFFYSKPDFEVNNINRNNLAGREILSYDQPVEGINGNLTLYYILSRK